MFRMLTKNSTVQFIVVILMSANIFARQITVTNSSELSTALRNAKSPTVIFLKPGEYTGGLYFDNLTGLPDAPIVIQGSDPNDPPVFSGGGSQAIHLVNCSWIHLANIKATGFPLNGINIDDGGTFDTPAHHITLENITVQNTGPDGNHDALKMSGVDHFTVKNCRFEGWGGSGVDMVGCHQGTITQCTFIGKKEFSQSNAVQMKGGTEKVIVEKCFFKNTGHRSINIGGSTGLQFFRPKLNDYEAKDITVAGNTFIGSAAPIAWATAQGGHVHHNTIIFPDKWILRILQETQNPKFKQCADGTFENNLIIYDKRVYTFVNVGPNTAPQTFTFNNNAWLQTDGSKKPILPTKELNGVYQFDISKQKTNFSTGQIHSLDPRITSIGAKAYQKKDQPRSKGRPSD